MAVAYGYLIFHALCAFGTFLAVICNLIQGFVHRFLRFATLSRLASRCRIPHGLLRRRGGLRNPLLIQHSSPVSQLHKALW